MTGMGRRKKILVLGHRGMLGGMVASYFQPRHDVLTVAVRFDPGNAEPFLAEVRAAGADVVINGIGAIKQRTVDASTLLAVNAYMPRLLRRSLPATTLLVHPSTDCVFDGTCGPYAAGAPAEAGDAYGISKSLSETVKDFPSTLVIRCSVVGPDPKGRATGLLGWFLAQPRGAQVHGYVDHKWNGLTTLHWCQVVERILAGGTPVPAGAILQPGTEQVHSKYEMLLLFGSIFRPDIKVLATKAGGPSDRSLIPNLVVPPLPEQLRELAAFMTANSKAGRGAA
jgi:dTDP-4-dehydrorhamnose reductase